MRRSLPHLTVTGHQVTFDQHKRRKPRREERKYDVIVTGLDNDESRWEALKTTILDS